MEIALTRPIAVVEQDQELVRRVARGDEDALRALYAGHGPRLFAYALRFTGDRSVAEEVVQDTLLAVWKGARDYRGDSRVSTWLLGIVHNQSLNAMRRKRVPTTGLEGVCQEAADAERLEDLASAGDRRRALSVALAQLSPDHRAVLQLVFYQGLSLAETARVLDCPVGTVKSRLSYAKTYLRQALRRAGLGAEDLL